MARGPSACAEPHGVPMTAGGIRPRRRPPRRRTSPAPYTTHDVGLERLAATSADSVSSTSPPTRDADSAFAARASARLAGGVAVALRAEPRALERVPDARP